MSTHQGPEFTERFWSYVLKTASCWLWAGSRDTHGYGQFRHQRAHRIAYELTKGAIPIGKLVCHSCDVPWCVCPDHLFIGSAADNAEDAVLKGRRPGAAPRFLNTPKGATHHRARLTEDNVRDILIQTNANTATMSDLARKYGIARQSVRDIVQRRCWKHVTI